MMKRRTLLGAVGAGTITALTGCLGVVWGGEPLELTAEPIQVPPEILEETGYEDAGTDEFVVEREFEVLGQSREVIATNQQVEYEKTVGIEPLGSVEAAMFTGLTTPSVSILGREFNPLGNMGTDEIVEMAQERYEGIENVEQLDETTLTIHEDETTAGIYRADATLMGQSIEVRLHISEAVNVGEDLAIAVGAHPDFAEDEAETIHRMMESIEPV